MKRFICVLLLIALILSLASCSEEVVWPTSELGQQIPTIDGAKGEVNYYSTSISISLEDITKKQYDDYVEACVLRGFTIETVKNETSFSAYNEKGYKLDIYFYSGGDVKISLDAPTTMAEIDWNKHQISEILPMPKSNIGAFEVENDDNTTVVIGRITTEEYEEYCQLCKNNGFTIDEENSSTGYSAYNDQGYKLSLSYTSGNRELRIKLDNPIEFSNITWPTVGIATIVPVPPSLLGSETSYYDWTYSVYISMTKDEYDAYVQQCIDSGFNKDVSKYENSFWADYSDDERIQIAYKGNNTVYISITGSINKDYSSYIRNPGKNEVSDDVSSDDKTTISNEENSGAVENEHSSSSEISGETETSSVEPSEHVHNFLEATCEAPKTCIDCGATEGGAKVHSWCAATCTSPKKCELCGKTSGDKLAHNYANGACSNCGAKDPNYVPEILVWIPTNGGKKYHSHSGCSNMDNPRQVTLSEALALGFTACARC